jgi:hypothetical protein
METRLEANTHAERNGDCTVTRITGRLRRFATLFATLPGKEPYSVWYADSNPHRLCRPDHRPSQADRFTQTNSASSHPPGNLIQVIEHGPATLDGEGHPAGRSIHVVMRWDPLPHEGANEDMGLRIIGLV